MHQEKWSDYRSVVLLASIFLYFFLNLSVLRLYSVRLRIQYRSRSQLIWLFDSVSNYRTHPSYWFHAADLAERYDSLADPLFGQGQWPVIDHRLVRIDGKRTVAACPMARIILLRLTRPILLFMMSM